MMYRCAAIGPWSYEAMMRTKADCTRGRSARGIFPYRVEKELAWQKAADGASGRAVWLPHSLGSTFSGQAFCYRHFLVIGATLTLANSHSILCGCRCVDFGPHGLNHLVIVDQCDHIGCNSR
jgi:hypothetical protein